MIAGIIGKPNSGKSTFFNAATLLNVPVASYPFTTIEPNLGVAYVRAPCVCRELGVEDNPINSLCVEGNRLIPVRLVDVAGLVPGASAGRGLGNKFLDELRQADVLVHVVDATGSTDEEGRMCPPGSRDPLLDMEFVEREFDLWLRGILTRDWPRISRAAEAGAGKLIEMLAERLSGLGVSADQVVRAAHDAGLNLEKPTAWSEDDLLSLSSSLRLASKPMVIAANKSDLPAAADNIRRLKDTGRFVIPCAAEGELLLRRASAKTLIRYIPGDPSFTIMEGAALKPEQRRALELVEEKVLKVWGSTGVQQALNAAYLDLWGGVVVYPVEDETRLSDKKGNVLPDAYIMKKGSTVRDLAYAIHTELGKTFLHAVDAKRGVRLAADHILTPSSVIKITAAAKRG